MRKLSLDMEALAVESFELDAGAAARGTVRAASDDTGTYPTNTCPATQLLSHCASACMQSGNVRCFATDTCC